MNSPHPVVVGVDGSAQSDAAVAWAAREAVLRHRPLRAVHAFVWPLLRVSTGPLPGGPPDSGLRGAADRMILAAAATARDAAPAVAVTGAVVTGHPAGVLVAESHSAALVILGNRGLGGFSGLLAGSVAVPVAAHAACPVVVVRDEAGQLGPSAGRVVVAVDGSPLSELAVGFAFEEAAWWGVGLTAVHAWTHPTSTGPDDPLPLVYDVDAVIGDEERLLAEQLAGWRDRYPDVDVRRRVVHGRASKVVVEESHGATLLVVGSRGRGGFRGLLLGSVSQAALHHAGCPVAIVR